MTTATDLRKSRTAAQRRVGPLISAVFIVWIVLTVVTIWIAAKQVILRSCGPCTPMSQPLAHVNLGMRGHIYGKSGILNAGFLRLPRMKQCCLKSGSPREDQPG